jgi:hypothetical protein
MHLLTQSCSAGKTRSTTSAASHPRSNRVLLDFFTYFSALTASRRETPTDDLASAIANGASTAN